jgi:hypothetical protein
MRRRPTTVRFASKTTGREDGARRVETGACRRGPAWRGAEGCPGLRARMRAVMQHATAVREPSGHRSPPRRRGSRAQRVASTTSREHNDPPRRRVPRGVVSRKPPVERFRSDRGGERRPMPRRTETIPGLNRPLQVSNKKAGAPQYLAPTIPAAHPPFASF